MIYDLYDYYSPTLRKMYIDILINIPHGKFTKELSDFFLNEYIFFYDYLPSYEFISDYDYINILTLMHRKYHKYSIKLLENIDYDLLLQFIKSLDMQKYEVLTIIEYIPLHRLTDEIYENVLIKNNFNKYTIS